MTKSVLEDLLWIEKNARVGAGMGRPVDQATLGHALADKALELSDLSFLEEAEFWYKEAIKNGAVNLEPYMNDTWPRKKEIYKEMIINGEK